MKKAFLISAALLFTLTSKALAADEEDPNYVLGPAQVQEIKTETLSRRAFASTALGSSLCAQSAGSRFLLKAPDAGEVLGDLNLADAALDQIINMGKKVWDIVKAGQPVVNLKTDVATALPAGAKCWMDLQNWKAPVAKTYQVTYKNMFGIEVIRFRYRVVFVAGGSVEGKGAYIGYAAIEPAEVSVAWGFNFKSESSVTTIYNMGSKQDPIAGLNLQVSYQIDSVAKPIQESRSYFISGLGQIQALD
jgi:hypothetical protein